MMISNHYKKLKEISTIIMGLSPKGDTYNFAGEGIALLNGPTEFGTTYPKCTVYTTDSKRECMKGDLIFCVRGSTTGRMNWSDGIYSLGRGVCSIRGHSHQETKFIRYCIELNLDSLLKIAGGGTFPNLTKPDIENFTIPYPSNRFKIAAILSAYDDLIENNTRRIAILAEMAQSLYREWFVHFRFPGHEKKRMVESALGMIPEGWEVVKLGDLCFITMGQSPSSEFYNTEERGLPFHQGVSDFGERFPKDRMYCTVANRIAEAEDILFSVRAPVGRINLANKKIVIGRGVSAIRSKTGNQCFVFQQLKELFQEEDIIGNGAIFKAVTKEDMHGIKMIRPPQPIIMSFEQQIQPIFSNLEVLIQKNANLRQTRDLLLPKLIAGEVDVEGLEIAGIEETGEVETKAVGV